MENVVSTPTVSDRLRKLGADSEVITNYPPLKISAVEVKKVKSLR